MLDLETMRSFVQVAEMKSFSKAAHNLHKTSATISYRIKMLEENVGAQLFHRTTRTVELTAAGEHLLEQCKQWLIWLDGITKELQQINDGIEPSVNITINNLLYNVEAVTELLVHLNQRFPQTKITISRQIFMGVWDSLIYDNYHLAIGAPGEEALTSHYEMMDLGAISWAFIVAKDHPILEEIGDKTATEALLRQYPAINTEDTARNLQKRTAWLLKGQKEIKVPNMRTKLACHLQGLGIGFLPRTICQPYLDSGELVEIKIPNHRVPSKMMLAWNTELKGKIVQEIIDLFEQNDPIAQKLLKNIDLPITPHSV
ncbi:HTH-type transcriptional activator AllS [Ignatzschineria larvae DSM 13226]|uniref:HTH-type transcriptional activator AllS n=1 Tax=Ignatzschineria larvae DSM 13226 TaxID=1111732 RepID=A0ABZ3BYF1_9GAMM|nr:HTH-type transcriptional activator AllS [Ignatzschineria larvae]